MTKKKYYIQEEVTDWHDEVVEAGLIFTSQEEMIDAIRRGEKTIRVARAAIVSRLLGKAPDDIVGPNKLLLSHGASYDIRRLVRKLTESVETPTGEYQARSFVGTSYESVQEEDKDAEHDTERSFVPLADNEAGKRAVFYLEHVLPGHIWNHLLIAHASGINVKALATMLYDKIDEMVGKLTY
jgi:hypothetical protein